MLQNQRPHSAWRPGVPLLPPLFYISPAFVNIQLYWQKEDDLSSSEVLIRSQQDRTLTFFPIFNTSPIRTCPLPSFMFLTPEANVSWAEANPEVCCNVMGLGTALAPNESIHRCLSRRVCIFFVNNALIMFLC